MLRLQKIYFATNFKKYIVFKYKTPGGDKDTDKSEI